VAGVRHGASFLAASASALGLSALKTNGFWWAAAGVASMGVFNVGTSFALALATAMRARGLRAPERSALLKALGRRVWRRPADLLAPDPTS
jgi:site-specific recombinase